MVRVLAQVDDVAPHGSKQIDHGPDSNCEVLGHQLLLDITG